MNRRGPLVFFVLVLASGFLYLFIVSRQDSGVISNLVKGSGVISNVVKGSGVISNTVEVSDSNRTSALQATLTEPKNDYIPLFKPDPLCKNTDRNPFRVNNSLLDVIMPAFREYAEWHRKERNHLLSKDPEKLRNIRTLIWHFKEYPKSPGLADKVRGLSAALLLSIMSKRLFFIQWSSQPFRTSRQRSIFEPNHINWDIDEEILTIIGKNFTISKPDFELYIPVCFSRNKCKSPEDVRIINKVMTKIFSCGEYHDQHIFLGNTLSGVLGNFLDKYSNSTNNCTLNHKSRQMPTLIFHSFGWTVKGSNLSGLGGFYCRYLFKFSDSILNRASHELKKIGIQVDQTYSICHIRTGFYGLYNETLFGTKVTEAETWKRLIDSTIANSRKSFGADAPVLVVTDSDLVKQWVRKEYSGSVKVTEGAVGHIGMRGNGLTDKDIEEIEYQTGTELSIMAHSNLLTTSVGGFGFLARKLCL